jgi:hypothetical protein
MITTVPWPPAGGRRRPVPAPPRRPSPNHLAPLLMLTLTCPSSPSKITGAAAVAVFARSRCEEDDLGPSCCAQKKKPPRPSLHRPRSPPTRPAAAVDLRSPPVSPRPPLPSFSHPPASVRSLEDEDVSRARAWPEGHAGPCRRGPVLAPFCFSFFPLPLHLDYLLGRPILSPVRPRRFPPVFKIVFLLKCVKTRELQMLITPIIQTQIM